MTYPIMPVSPLPAGIGRTRDWKTDGQRYDSGAWQAMTTYTRPLFQYQIPFQNINEVKLGLLTTLADSVQGTTLPFLMKDPYEYQVSSVLAVASGVSAGTLQLYDTRSFFIRADTTTVGSLFSALSGYVKLGTNYNYDQDTGILTIITKSNTDAWGVRSAEYFRKVHFANNFQDQAVLWNIFNATIQIDEIV